MIFEPFDKHFFSINTFCQILELCDSDVLLKDLPKKINQYEEKNTLNCM
jgi:hypothetical protein